MSSVSLENFDRIVKHAWSAETSASPQQWTPDNPARGQCVPTAALAQQFFSGVIVNSQVAMPNGTTESHYYNLIGGGRYDFSREQYDAARGAIGQPVLKTGGLGSTYNYMCSFPAALDQVARLASRFEALGHKRPEHKWLVVISSETDLQKKFANLATRVAAAKAEGFKVGLMAKGNDQPMRDQLSQLPFIADVDAVLVAPVLTTKTIDTFAMAHGLSAKSTVRMVAGI